MLNAYEINNENNPWIFKQSGFSCHYVAQPMILANFITIVKNESVKVILHSIEQVCMIITDCNIILVPC